MSAERLHEAAWPPGAMEGAGAALRGTEVQE
jgi:hypothetical protein